MTLDVARMQRNNKERKKATFALHGSHSNFDHLIGRLKVTEQQGHHREVPGGGDVAIVVQPRVVVCITCALPVCAPNEEKTQKTAQCEFTN